MSWVRSYFGGAGRGMCDGCGGRKFGKLLALLSIIPRREAIFTLAAVCHTRGFIHTRTSITVSRPSSLYYLRVVLRARVLVPPTLPGALRRRPSPYLPSGQAGQPQVTLE